MEVTLERKFAVNVPLKINLPVANNELCVSFSPKLFKEIVNRDLRLKLVSINQGCCYIAQFNSLLFCFLRLPIPRPGEVLGLVGTNGIGKSTALKILAGKQKPNLGRFNVC